LLAEKIIQGDVRSAARLIRRIDDGDQAVIKDLRALYAHAGSAHVIGFTGSPGVGKSTLVDKMIQKYRKDNKTVGILAVDPTSPFSGGAILGDRIRMQNHALDEGVFIRSMATRGSFGGLTRSTADAIVVLEALGKDVIIVETVGVGQDEVDIAHSAHTTVLVTIPGMGDEIQAIKAGLMEIGDIFVVNKADRDGAPKTVRELEFMLHMSSNRYQADGWMPPIIKTQAILEEGLDELYQVIGDHQKYLKDAGGHKLRKRQEIGVQRQLMDLLKEKLTEAAVDKIGGPDAVNNLVKDIVAGRNDPYGVCMNLIDQLIGGS
jgi:LAO/AO transport system kinase